MSKLYFHYKNKPYKLLGTVKHSETLEDLALYETLYENKSGKLWVRPKDMFFEDVVVDGVKQKRFAPVEIEIEERTSFGEGEIVLLDALHKAIFDGEDLRNFTKHVVGHPKKIHLGIARIRGELVGYKIGFSRNDQMLYSWLGGVDPKWRGLGIASLLMEAQHRWAKAQGFVELETRTMNQYPQMISLNLRCGFQIVGTLTEPSGAVKLILRKQL